MAAPLRANAFVDLVAKHFAQMRDVKSIAEKMTRVNGIKPKPMIVAAVHSDRIDRTRR